MKQNSLRWRGAAAAFLAVAAAGCYNYKEPAAATLGESYTARQRDASDEIFKGMTVLTLRDAQRIAIRNNPTYIAAYHSMEAARMKYLQAWGAYSPTVTASFSLNNERDWIRNYSSKLYPGLTKKNPHTDAFTTSTGITANMLLFDGFARMFRLKAAKSDFNYYARMEEDACRTMMMSVAYAYNTVLLAIENRRIALEDRKFQQSSLQNTQYKFEAGAAPLSDVLNFEIYVNNADVSLIDADYQYEVAIYALAQLMGYPEGILPADLKFPEDFKTKFEDLPAVEIYLDAALANRPDLKAYRERLNVARYQVYQAWGAYSPVVYGYVKWGYGTSERKYVNYSGDGHHRYSENMQFSYGLNAEWTIFNGFIRMNQLREAKAARAAAEYQVAASWFAVVSEVRTAYANYIQNVKKTKLYAKIRSLSAKQRDLVDDEYRAGNAELTRLNEAQRDLVQAETSLASSYINVQNAKAQLDSVVGGNTAEYYLTDDGTKPVYPGLGGVAGIEETIQKNQDKGAATQTAPMQAPDVKRDPSGNAVRTKADTTDAAQPHPAAAAPAQAAPQTTSADTTTPAQAAPTAAADTSSAPAIPASATAAPQKH
ncbi:MAG: TolC family protein [Lentisphaeria bacterium]|nr:TolC family protein [Lentisphaeria bacterium]